MKVLVDAFGGDNAPNEIIKGSLLAVREHKDLKVVLYGDSKIINSYLSQFDYDRDQIEVVHTSQVISNNEAPVDAVKSKTDSSIVRAIEDLRIDDSAVGFVSAGSTGAVLTATLLKLGRIKGIKRPALAPIIPTKIGTQALICDCGANMDCDEYNLLQFALMGSAYMKSMYKVDNPKVALLSVGVEDHKGNAVTKKAFELLKNNQNINFVGNMEARDALSGKYDVIVCDGFAGNVLTKTIEGTASFIMGQIKSMISGSVSAKIGAFFMQSSLKKMKDYLDYNKRGGAPFLGAKKIVIKSHGSSKASSIRASIEQVMELYKAELISNISTILEGSEVPNGQV
jgi:phosphate acyltransferase